MRPSKSDSALKRARQHGQMAVLAMGYSPKSVVHRGTDAYESLVKAIFKKAGGRAPLVKVR